MNKSSRKRKFEQAEEAVQEKLVLSPVEEAFHSTESTSYLSQSPEIPSPKFEADKLCERCRSIDLDNAFTICAAAQQPSGREIVALGEITEALETSRCPLCRLFAATHKPIDGKLKYKNRGHHLRAFDINAVESALHGKATYTSKPSVVLSVVQGLTRSHLEWYEKRNSFSRGVIAEASFRIQDREMLAPHAKLINRSKADFDQIRRWLDHCRNLHPRCSERDRVDIRLPNLSFIDCFSRAIIPGTPEMEYFALSYVWEDVDRKGIEKNEVRSSQNLPPKVSQTIEDAILAVKSIGGRYLWVDRYCINQEDTSVKHSQIQAMDRVYEGATATIIAISSLTCSSGLPGVGTLPRKHHPHATIGSRLLTTTLPHISYPMTESLWFKRAWTYQEAILSTRCLFFTDRQVYYHCRGMTCHESVNMVPSAWLTPKSHMSLPVVQPFLSLSFFSGDDPSQSVGNKKNTRNGLWEFFYHLCEYKSREMSYDSDSLNAFKGVLARSSFRSFWGVPFAFTQDLTGRKDSFTLAVAFARGLWWRPTSTQDRKLLSAQHRRCDFPSWSWAGWAGEIKSASWIGTNRADDNMCNSVNESNFHTDFVFESTTGAFSTLDQLYDSANKSKIITEFPCLLHIKSTVVKVRFQPRKNPKNGTTKPVVCSCHPNTVHMGQLEDSHRRFTSVELCMNPNQDARIREKLYTQLWDLLILCESNPKANSAVHNYKGLSEFRALVVEWEGKAASVIGMIELDADTRTFRPFIESHGTRRNTPLR